MRNFLIDDQPSVLSLGERKLFAAGLREYVWKETKIIANTAPTRQETNIRARELILHSFRSDKTGLLSLCTQKREACPIN